MKTSDSSVNMSPDSYDWRLRLAKAAICLTVLIDMLGVGLIVPVIPNLLREISNTSISDAAKIGGWLLFIYAAFQIIFGPIFGHLSDKFGRRPILVFALIGLTIDYAIMFFATTIAVLFIGRAISGALGATFPVATAYMSDISDDQNRTSNFGYVEAAAGVGLIFGPALGGLIGSVDPRYPFLAAAILAFVNFIFVLIFVPETLPSSKSSSHTSHGFFTSTGRLLSARNVLLCIIAFFLFEFAAQSLPAVWPFFTIEKMTWTPLMIGFSMAFFGLLIAAVQSLFLGPLCRFLGEKGTIIFGSIASVLGYCGLAYTSDFLWATFFLLITALGTVVFPTVKSVASMSVSENDQGKLQGILAGVTSLSILVGALVMTYTFSAFTTGMAVASYELLYFPGAPFILSGIIFCVSLSVSFLIVKK